jgi:hypothetical protein
MELKELWNNGVKTRDAGTKKNFRLQRLRRILDYMLYFFGQLMTSQPMLCCLVGALKESLHVHTATNILSICG